MSKLSRRDEFAKDIMAAIISNGNWKIKGKASLALADFVPAVVGQADDLIRELDGKRAFKTDDAFSFWVAGISTGIGLGVIFAVLFPL